MNSLQAVVPVAIDDVPVAEPVADHVPEPIQGKQLEPGVRHLHACVGWLISEFRIADITRHGEIELFSVAEGAILSRSR